MDIEEGKFYFIKNEYFDIFKNEHLMLNKENGNKRPCFLCFRDSKYNKIIWFIPISHKVEKYKAIYTQKKKKRKRVINFVFGKILNNERVFLIQNMFPVTKDLIESKYTKQNKDVEITYELKEEVINYAKELIKITEMKGNIIAFNDIIKIRDILLEKEVVKN